MSLSKKNTILIFGGIGIIMIGYFTYLYYKIVAAYNTVLTVDQANSLVNDATKDVPDIDPNDYQQDDDNDTNNGITLGQNRTDAVQLDNIVWLGDSNTGLYTANDGSNDVYNDNQQIINYPDGTTASVNPDDVTYGYFDNDANEFTAY
jgi:hypothetical protein